jgi:hypothetical protein
MQYRWAAGLFQFLVVFGTLFLLDLIPIASKLLSRPGAYDVLVEHSEFVVNANWTDFSQQFGLEGKGLPEDFLGKDHPSLPDAALLLLKARYLAKNPTPDKSPVEVCSDNQSAVAPQ